LEIERQIVYHLKKAAFSRQESLS